MNNRIAPLCEYVPPVKKQQRNEARVMCGKNAVAVVHGKPVCKDHAVKQFKDHLM